MKYLNQREGERERVRERERECVCVCVRERERDGKESKRSKSECSSLNRLVLISSHVWRSTLYMYVLFLKMDFFLPILHPASSSDDSRVNPAYLAI